MRKHLYILLLSLFVLASCKSIEYVEVPVETIKTEYRNQLRVDTVLTHDSIITREKGDTVFLEKYKYIYRVKELRDTVNITDTIPVIQTVETVKEVNRLHKWQMILMVMGGGFIVLAGYKLITFIKT